MTRISIGDVVAYPLNNGGEGRGAVLEVVAQKGQPTVFLIGDDRGEGRAFRLLEDLTPLPDSRLEHRRTG